MSFVSILGSGNVGANTAFFIAEKGVTDVVLVDVQAGLAAGKSLDMMEAAPIRKYRNRLTGADSIEAIKGAETVIIAAGAGRRPGMKREELYGRNAGLIRELAAAVPRLAPDSAVVVATEPVDPLTTLFARESGMDRRQVMGLGCLLDCTRLRWLVARELAVSMENVSALIIGRHSEDMIGLPRCCGVSGVPLPQLLPAPRIAELLAETARAGDLIVEMAQRASAYYAPSAAAAELADSIHMDLRRIFPVSLVLAGEYGLEGAALSLPAVIGRGGIARVLAPALTPDERERLARSAAEVRRIVEGGAA